MKTPSKASMRDVKKAVARYVHTSLFDRDYMNEADLSLVRASLRPFSNVEVHVEPSRRRDGSLDCVISVSQFLMGPTLRYEVRSNGHKKKYYDPLAWIDDIERWDALFF